MFAFKHNHSIVSLRLMPSASSISSSASICSPIISRWLPLLAFLYVSTSHIRAPIVSH